MLKCPNSDAPPQSKVGIEMRLDKGGHVGMQTPSRSDACDGGGGECRARHSHVANRDERGGVAGVVEQRRLLRQRRQRAT